MRSCVWFSFLVLVLAHSSFAQTDSSKIFSFSLYGELYYSNEIPKTADRTKPFFLYNHKSLRQPGLNLFFARSSCNFKRFRCQAGLMSGDYAHYNLSQEPAWARWIYEAHAGLQLMRNKNLWLDAGIMPSHIGFESAVSADCWTLTRSILAENSPYYETGVRLSYTSTNGKWYFAGMLLNGWQKIAKRDGINKPSFGTQVSYQPNENLTLNYSTFLGSATPEALPSFRHFHNLYAQYAPAGKTGITLGFDLGSDKNSSGVRGIWYSPAAIVRQYLNKKTALALRGEYYNDARQILLLTSSPRGFRVSGFSANLDYRLSGHIAVRAEVKMYHSADKIFTNQNNNFSFTTNATFRL